MQIDLHPFFTKAYRKRISPNPKLAKKAAERIALFSENPFDPVLKNHALKGQKRERRAFSVTGDIRVVYCAIGDDHVLFLDIGTHNQVY